MKRKISIRYLVALALLALLIPLSEARDPAAEKSHQQDRNPSPPGVKASRIASAGGNMSVQLPARGRAEDTELPPAAFEKLVIHAGFGWGIFSGTLYNGNSDYTVTGVTVRFTPLGKGNGDAENSSGGNEYDLELNLEPLSKTALSMPIPSDNTLEYSWKITKARGYKTQ
ncbi:MAG TPA: hypothetical protein VFI43_09505 [Nitrosospira sp.]|nr:hypothetical protein [Nitrosospira sp.]